MKRRKNREGSLGKRKNGTWYASLRTGSRRLHFYGPTCESVRAKLAVAASELSSGAPIITDRSRVAGFFARWIASLHDARPSTIRSYQSIIDRHIVPALGPMRLTALTPYHIEQVLNSARKRKVTGSTLAHIRAVFKMALKVAVRWELVRRNVADLVPCPKRERPTIHPLDHEAFRAFLGALKGHEYEALFLLAVTCGLRKGELLGLHWSDINLESSTLTVNRTLQRGPIRKTETGVLSQETRVELPPKTKTSTRTIRLPASVVAALRAWRKYQLKLRMKAGERWHGWQPPRLSPRGFRHALLSQADDPRRLTRGASTTALEALDLSVRSVARRGNRLVFAQGITNGGTSAGTHKTVDGHEQRVGMVTPPDLPTPEWLSSGLLGIVRPVNATETGDLSQPANDVLVGHGNNQLDAARPIIRDVSLALNDSCNPGDIASSPHLESKQIQSTITSDDYVFSTHLGTPIDERNLTRIYEKILKAAKLPHHRFHDLRHTAASLLFAEGVPIKAISQVLGHSSVTITLDTYVSILPNMADDAAKAMDDLVTRKK